MKRAPFVIAGTAAGVAGVLSFHTQPRVSAASQPKTFSSPTTTSAPAPRTTPRRPRRPPASTPPTSTATSRCG